LIIDLQKAFKDIRYRDSDHTYYNVKTGKPLTPTTTYKKQFQNEFDNYYYWLDKKAKENNLTQAEMQEEWTEQKEIGIGRGNSIHKFAEALSWRKFAKLDLNYPGIAKLKRQVLDYFEQDTYYTIATEIVVGNDVVSGTIDRLAENEFGQIILQDWKTDKEFKPSFGKFLKAPFQEYPDDTISGYYLQTNSYRQILEDAGFKIDFVEIIHFGINNDNWMKYEVPRIEIKFN